MAAQVGLEEYTAIKTGSIKKGSYLNIVIKALPSATYGNIVDVLDEMRICGIRYYLILDISPAELDFVRNPANGLRFMPEI